MLDASGPPATSRVDSYPRPQLVRSSWTDLSGTWRFDFDDDTDPARVSDAAALERSIVVPFPPESPASGIGERAGHRAMWYRRTVTTQEVAQAGHAPDRRLVIHFGAVDYRAEVWVDGSQVGRHEGGHTPFSVEVPYAEEDFDLVVRVKDDQRDLAQPRGKQDWADEPHVVWYERTSGIWQPVWLESVPRQHLARLSWKPSVTDRSVRLTAELAERPGPGTYARIVLRLGDTTLAETRVLLTEREATIPISVEALRNGQSLADYLWSPERPTLVDAIVELEAPGQEADAVRSYFGFRDVGEGAGRFLLNGKPYAVRGVLSQGYWPESHLAAPDADALRAEVQLIKDLGFNTVRVHQKIEDPRFLAWADRIGVLVWAELPSAYEFSATAATRLVGEWSEAIRRDSSHPSIVAWVPFNESWGVHDVATDSRQQHLVRTLYHLTKTLDDSRLVISNDGWEHLRSDLLTIHDYQNDPARLHASYANAEAIARGLAGIAPNGRRMLVGTPEEADSTATKPVVLSEFGGASIEPNGTAAWGYRLVASTEALEEHLAALFSAVHRSEALAGWCFTQLTDTAQETNGLADAQRRPKLPAARIRAMVEGGAGTT